MTINFLNYLPESFWEGQKLTREQVINFLDRGCGKDVKDIWNEDPDVALGNMLKAVQPDTGGTQGERPEALVVLVEEIQSMNVKDASAFLYTWIDTRNKAIRISQIKRIAMIRTKLRGEGIYYYYEELTRMVNQTLEEHRKLAKRRKFANTSIVEAIKQG